MLDIVKERVAECKNLILVGFSSTRESNLQWLNKLCESFLSLFNILHKHLVFDATNFDFLEKCFLCTKQITCCIKNLDRTLKEEQSNGIVLTPTRQFFLDRALWCLTQLNNVIDSSLSYAPSCLSEQNFTNYMDNCLDMVTSLTDASFNISNICEMNAEAMIKSKNIRKVVDSLISHALGFMNVALEEDKKPITALCHKVLKEAIELEAASSLADPLTKPNDKDRRLKAQLLETALLQLENIVNESVLRLLYQVFVDLSNNPIQKLRKQQKDSPNDLFMVDELTAEFDTITDRLMQIGIFALAFADNKKISADVRSCLASLESLDEHLIPSILSENCEIHSNLLEKHWNDEIHELELQIQKIIDSDAFVMSLLETLEGCIQSCSKTFDASLISDVVAKSKILYQHFEINEQLLHLNNEDLPKFFFQDFKLILKECVAAVDYIGKIDESRIIKRMKILKSTMKKLQKAVTHKSKVNALVESKAESNKQDVQDISSDDLKHSVKLFTSFGIRASARSILYRTQRNSMRLVEIEDFQETPPVEEQNLPKLTTTGKKRRSLRVAMFKRHKLQHTRELVESITQSVRDDTMGLNITDILDQLTDLSTTLTEKCAFEQ